VALSGCRSRRRGGRRDDRLADRHARISRPPRLRVGPGVAARRAGLCDGLRVHRFPAVRRAGADLPARQLWLGARRLLVSRHPHLARCHSDVRLRALSLRLSAGAHRFPGAGERHAGSGTYAGHGAVAGLLCRIAAAGPPGHRGRYCAGPDGNPGRLRHRSLFCSQYLHYRHLPRLVLAGRPRGCRPTGRHGCSPSCSSC